MNILDMRILSGKSQHLLFNRDERTKKQINTILNCENDMSNLKNVNTKISTIPNSNDFI